VGSLGQTVAASAGVLFMILGVVAGVVGAHARVGCPVAQCSADNWAYFAGIGAFAFGAILLLAAAASRPEG